MARLEKLINVEQTFSRAIDYLYATRVLQKLGTNLVLTVAHSYVTLAALALELHLKVLAQLEREEPPLDTHNLKFLAGDLKKESYKRIAKAWRATWKSRRKQIGDSPHVPDFAKVPAEFRDALDKSATAFVDFRYFIPERHAPAWQLDGATEEVQRMILELKPELLAVATFRVEQVTEADGQPVQTDQQERPHGWAALNWRRAH